MAMFAAHIKLSKHVVCRRKLMRIAVSVPGLMKKSIQRDYRNNLY